MNPSTDIPARVIGLVSPSSYRATMFRDAARRLGLDWVEVIDQPAAIARSDHGRLALDFSDVPDAVTRIVALGSDARAVIAVDDRGTLLAAEANARLHLPHNDPGSALAGRDKLVMRERLAAGDVPVPRFRALGPDEDPVPIAEFVGYPCVVKPTRLNGSRGVIRADTADEVRAAVVVTRRIVAAAGDPDAGLLIERFVPGFEVALEGLLTDGALEVLALFDKPDPLDGPLFEETIYVTPSRLDPDVQDAVVAMTARLAAALGLRHGPLHAELRVDLTTGDIWPIELAGRSIGGLCASVLEFGAGIGLDEVILRHAVGMPLPGSGFIGNGFGDAAASPKRSFDKLRMTKKGLGAPQVDMKGTLRSIAAQLPLRSTPRTTGSSNIILSGLSSDDCHISRRGRPRVGPVRHRRTIRRRQARFPGPQTAEPAVAMPRRDALRRIVERFLHCVQDRLFAMLRMTLAGKRVDRLSMPARARRADTRSAPTTILGTGAEPVLGASVARADIESAPTTTGSPNVVLSLPKDLLRRPAVRRSAAAAPHLDALRRIIERFLHCVQDRLFAMLKMTNAGARADIESAPTRVGASGVASGVMMIPIPRGGMLRAVGGIDAAKNVPGIVDIDITAPLNAPIMPLPEGESYLGFIFARAATPDLAETALRDAHARLEIRIDPTISLVPVTSLPVQQPGDQGGAIAGDRVDLPLP